MSSSQPEPKCVQQFQKGPVYNEVVEHISEKQGTEYLRLIAEDPEIFGFVEESKANDKYGNPRMYEYPSIGTISPTTLRYVKVLADLKSCFDTLESRNVCEIGVGYGGQCRIVNAFYKPAKYCLVDIRPALLLARRFLDKYVMRSVLTYKTMRELRPQQFDLVLSNYAFTELPRDIQDVYLEQIIANSKRGYITYNEISPEHFNSYKSDELLRAIPGSIKLKEEPLTHPVNCIIVWGTNI